MLDLGYVHVQCVQTTSYTVHMHTHRAGFHDVQSGWMRKGVVRVDGIIMRT